MVSTDNSHFPAELIRALQLRWSVGVKLLSQADDAAPTVETSAPHPPDPITEEPGPFADDTHPGNRETDPFFTTQRGLSQDEQEETRSRSMTAPSIQTNERTASPAPSSGWVPEPSSAKSQHPMARPGANGTGIAGSYAAHVVPQRRKPTRTDSGREFWGLPERPRRRNTLLSQEILEDDSSEDESENEWVSDIAPRS